MSLPLVFQAGVRAESMTRMPGLRRKAKAWASRYLDEIQRVLDPIEHNPEIHAPIYRTIRHGRLKRFAYAVYYRIEPDRIAIMAVRHAKQDPRGWQSRA